MSTLAAISDTSATPIGKAEAPSVQAQFLTAQAVRNAFDVIRGFEKDSDLSPAAQFGFLLSELVKCETSHATEVLKRFVELTRVKLTPEQIKANEGKKGKTATHEDGPETQTARVFRNYLMNCYGAVRYAGVRMYDDEAGIFCFANYKSFATDCAKALKKAGLSWNGLSEEHIQRTAEKKQQRKYINAAGVETGVADLDFAALMSMTDADRQHILEAAANIETQDKAEKRLERMNKAAKAAAESWSETFGLDGARELWEQIGGLLGMTLVDDAPVVEVVAS